MAFILFLFHLSLFTANAVTATRGTRRAVAILFGVSTEASSVGAIHFLETSGVVQLNGTVSGLRPGFHGLHIHQFGDLSNRCKKIGRDYNPFGKSHGALNDKNKHMGDLGNILVDNSGVAKINITATQLKLSGRYSIIGRSIVVHRGADNFFKLVGTAAKRYACGVIAIASPN